MNYSALKYRASELRVSEFNLCVATESPLLPPRPQEHYRSASKDFASTFFSRPEALKVCRFSGKDSVLRVHFSYVAYIYYTISDAFISVLKYRGFPRVFPNNFSTKLFFFFTFLIYMFSFFVNIKRGILGCKRD